MLAKTWLSETTVDIAWWQVVGFSVIRFSYTSTPPLRRSPRVPATVQRLEVFISAPSDVAAEREAAAEVVEQLNKLSHISARYMLVAHTYEEGAPPIVGKRPQDVIDDYMIRAAESDIFICMMWQRFGTPMVDKAGDHYGSGTEYEFLDAYRSNQQTGRPNILLYRCTRPSADDVAEEQAKRVVEFFERFEGKDAEYKGLIQTYTTTDEFREQLLRDLDSLIARRDVHTGRTPVTLIGSFGNQGWTITFLLEEAAREIFYRFQGDENFKSTGHVQYVDQRTGRPAPLPSIPVAELQGARDIEVKYTDQFGRTKGPFTVTFDAEEQTVNQVKQILAMLPRWVDFRLYQGKLLVYFSTLLSWKSGIREIRYSVDKERPSKKLSFKPRLGQPSAAIDDEDTIYVAVPLDTEYVAVQLTFTDGTKSEIHKSTVPPGTLDKDG